MNEVLSNAPAQFGALGLLIILEGYAILKLWQQLQTERKARDEDREQCHDELRELNDKLISSQVELQLLLKSLTDGMQIEKLFREYHKKD